MKLFISTAAATQLFASVMAYTLPEGLVDGVYRVSYNSKGEEVHEGITVNFNATIVPAIAQRSENHDGEVARRDGDGRIWCGCGIQMNSGDCDSAVEKLKRQFDNAGGNPTFSTPWYSVTNSVVAFACPYGGDSMSRELYRWYLEQITNACGWYVPGTKRQDWRNLGYFSMEVGYMNYREGLNFCADATRGTPDRC